MEAQELDELNSHQDRKGCTAGSAGPTYPGFLVALSAAALRRQHSRLRRRPAYLLMLGARKATREDRCGAKPAGGGRGGGRAAPRGPRSLEGRRGPGSAQIGRTSNVRWQLVGAW
ncbi:unnamed protein product [Prorocentrum cordatum]|uniref:Uncharacterized protein n=1 Tax=Prorocentrum cordatum TaxID=2364126 RepID=A0ABN9VQ65_9DINO|nr:unnamed protein product [Polarella glacialis]